MAESAPIETLAGIVYATRDGMSLSGDLYRPAGAGPHPVVLAVPGGGWRASARSGLAHWARHLARAGMAVFAIEYRTSATAPSFPGAVCDVLAAIDFLDRAGTTLNLDPSRLGIVAASAGAHLAALATYAGGTPALQNACAGDSLRAPRRMPRALVLAYGVYDLEQHWHETRAAAAAGPDLVHQFLGSSPVAAPELYRLASPEAYVRTGMHAAPVLVTFGTTDTIVDPAQTTRFVAALCAAGVPVSQLPVPGAGHHWFSLQPLDDPATFTAGIAPAVTSFLLTHLHVVDS